MANFTLSPGERRRSIAIVIASTSVVAATLGLTWPLLSLILESRGVSQSLIGLSSASQTLAIVTILPLAPRLLARFGTLRVIRCSIATIVAMLLLLPAVSNVYAWFPIRFLLGAGLEIMLVAADIWINQVAEERTRGRTIGLYGFVLAASFAIGPLIINVTGIDGWAPFLIGAAIVALGAVPLLWAGGVVPPIEGHPSGRLLYFLRIAPLLMLAGLMYGLVDAAVLSFLPLYALAKGYTEQGSVLVLTVLILGSVLGQLPIGWLADRLDRRAMLTACTILTLLTAMSLPWVIDHNHFLWPTLLVWGAVLGGFYTLGMIMMGQRFRGADLAAVNAAFIVLWGIGGVGGPSLTGAAMDLLGPEGLPLVVAGGCLLYLGVAVTRHLTTGANTSI